MAHSTFNMVNVGSKESTHRKAIAEGRIFLTSEAFWAILNKTHPKGDVLSQAELAGILAAKRTSELIPLCHPIPLDQVQIQFQTDESQYSISVICEVTTTAKTGVEMEALTGVNLSLLAIYDASKIFNPETRIEDIHLSYKEGGKTGIWRSKLSSSFGNQEPILEAQDQILPGIRTGILTISDRCSQGIYDDLSGAVLEQVLKTWGTDLCTKSIVPDDVDRIRSSVLRQIRESRCCLVITTGGTGVGPRDVTPEALEPLWTKKIPGIGELLRYHGARFTPMSWISRSTGGIIENALVIALPGKPSAVQEGLDCLKQILPHLLKILGGGSH